MITDILPFYNSGDNLIVIPKDCCLNDSEGWKYIDFEPEVWCANIGHSNGFGLISDENNTVVGTISFADLM